jgi:hypothetical protein
MEDIEKPSLTARLSGFVLPPDLKVSVLAYKKKYNVSVGEVLRRALVEFFLTRSVNFSDQKDEKVDEVMA